NAELLALLAPLALAPVLARQWPSLQPDAEAGGLLNRLARPAGAGAVTLGLAVAVAFAAGMIRFAGITSPDANTPSAALAYAREAGLRGHVLNHYGYGGYLISAGVPTFIDGRGELYGGDFIKKYAEAVNLRGEEPFEQVLERWHIDWTLLAK